MTLTPGTRLGVYEVIAKLGEGGMGQVFRATDTKLKRQTTALVMELIEGEDLSQRIARGRIPIDEAVAIAKQIADALEAASTVSSSLVTLFLIPTLYVEAAARTAAVQRAIRQRVGAPQPSAS